MRTLIGVGIAGLLAVSAALHAQSPRGKAEATIENQVIEIDYGRPSLNGRDMLAQAPVGYVWRLGADQSTTLTTSGDLSFGDVTIPAGSYSLFAKRVGEDSWELVFNGQTGQWGTEHDPSRDIATVPLEWTKQETSHEEFTILVAALDEGGEIRMMWGENVLSTEFDA